MVKIVPPGKPVRSKAGDAVLVDPITTPSSRMITKDEAAPGEPRSANTSGLLTLVRYRKPERPPKVDAGRTHI
jgi:hypothetical protein